jgi:hypothetical protein
MCDNGSTVLGMATVSAPAAPPMQRRSWYIPQDVGDQLAAMVDEIHFATKRPKHEVLAAALALAVEHQADVLARVQDGAR